MKKTKQLLAVLLATVTVVAMVSGCGSKAAPAAEAAPAATEAAAPAAEAAPAATEAAPSDYKLELKLSHVFADGELLTITCDEVADAIRERTNGAIDIQTFPNGQIACYKEGVEQVVRGANFISVEDPSYLGDYVPDFNILAGPMIVSSFDEWEYLLQTDLVKSMFADAEKAGIKILTLDIINGFRSMKTSKPINTPADLKGMKIRTPMSETYVGTLNAMGANAIGMAFSETISAVQSGVVDGLEGTIGGSISDGSADVIKNMSLTNHLLGVCGAYINVDLWNSIPAEYQAIIQEEFTKGADKHVQTTKDSEATERAEMEKMGIVFNDVDQSLFADGFKELYANMPGVTPGRYDEIKKLCAEMPK